MKNKTPKAGEWNVDEAGRVYFLITPQDAYTLHDLDKVRPREHIDPGLMAFNVSEWVAHLRDKLFIHKRHLYELAGIIGRRHPQAPINWTETFYLIEVSSLLKSLYRQVHETHPIVVAQKQAQSSAASPRILLNGPQLSLIGKEYSRQAHKLLDETGWRRYRELVPPPAALPNPL